MSSYLYRDARRQKLDAALAAVTDDRPELRALLENERAALETDAWAVTDRTYLAVAADWLWSIRLTLKALVDEDPVLQALGTTAAVSDAQAAAIETLPRFPGGPPADFLDQVRAAVDQDETVFAELLHAAHRRWLPQAEEERDYPFDDVGVLLPLRLETLFDAPGSPHNDHPTRWKLSLRVVPDEASICRDNPHLSEGEGKALLAFWQAVQQPGELHEGWLEGEAAVIAWQHLADQVTPPRAAWLVATVPPRRDGDALALDPPADLTEEAQPNRVGGMPPELHLFALIGEAIHPAAFEPIGRLPMDEFRQIDSGTLTLPLPGAPDEDRKRWEVSWETAKAVGLGGEWLLPEGMTPETIGALFVVGIGDEPPDAHFKAQVDAGELGLLRHGVATNSVHGAPTADLGQDASDWRRIAQARLVERLHPGERLASNAARAVQRHLTGDENALPFFPGATLPDETETSHRMAAALWPALWGHWLRDLWPGGDDGFRTGLWAFEYLYPQGQLMPVRIGEQPYGLVPATALAEWEPHAGFDPETAAQAELERAMAGTLTGLRGRWAAAARGKRSVVGKSTAEFIQLLGQDALSHRYLWRDFVPPNVLMIPYQLSEEQRQEFVERAIDAYAEVTRLFGGGPDPLYLASGFWHWNDLPLVQPTRVLYSHIESRMRRRVPLPDFLTLLFEFRLVDRLEEYDLDAIFRRIWQFGDHEGQLAALPDSLLLRLLVYAVQLNFQWRLEAAGSEPEQRLLDLHQELAMHLAVTIEHQGQHGEEPDPVTGEPDFTLRFPDESRLQLERALRSTLDSAAHRIDPWITGFAWQRLLRHSGSARHTHRLGVYGWVDGPFDGRPGPTRAGRLHTPSYNQTLAALILRDKWLSSDRAAAVNDHGRNPWQMDITSGKARLAEEIAEEVRMGFHIYEIVGRQVEAILGHPQRVRDLRRNVKYAMRPERRDPNEVCNGINALRGLLKGGDPEATLGDDELHPGRPEPEGDPEFPLTMEQRDRLKLLHLALDTYGDLLMADGVLQLVNRQAERAAETMDAAAGFVRPPTFEFIRTPPSGYQLESMVVSALPFVAVETLADDATPIRLADPSVAAFLDATLGDTWTLRAVNADNGDLLGEMGPAAFGLTAVDTLGLSEELLRELARRALGLPLVFIGEGRNHTWRARDAEGAPLGEVTMVELNLAPEALATLDDDELLDKVRAALGVAEAAIVEEVPPDEPRLWIARDEYGALLGLASPASLGLTPAEVDALDPAELHRRVRLRVGAPQVRVDLPRTHQLAQQLVAALGSRPAAGRDVTPNQAAQAAVDAAIYGELRGRYTRLYAACEQLIRMLREAGDEAARAAALLRALTWGLTPIGEPADREALFAALLGTEPPAEATPLAELAAVVADALEARRLAAPHPDDLPLEEQIGAPLADQEERKQKNIPDGVASLAQALASLASPNGRLAILASWPREALLATTRLATAQPEPALDEEWLTVVAAARGPLARLEALQLELDPPLAAWTSAPGDPWQMAAVQANLAQRELDVTGISLPRFVAAYGSAAAWAGDRVAVGLIDAFGEAIPMPQRSTVTAFGFNAPAARAPQAILLAVPPRERERLDDDLLVRIVAEMRELTHARSARVEDLGPLQALTPTMWLRSSGPVRARLEPWPLFD